MNHLVHFGNEQAQNAVLELGVDVLLIDFVHHIESAATGADETLPTQIPLVLNTVFLGLLHGGADAEVAVLQFGGEVFLMDAG